MDIKILVAAHKEYQMPKDHMYIPIQVGAEGKESIGFIRDNTGDHISQNNERYCELTAAYWAWKNLKADYYGIVHYRRHFTCTPKTARLGKDKFKLIMDKAEAEAVLKDVDLIVPGKRKYYIETLRSHYAHLPFTYEKDIQVLEEVINEISPEYNDIFQTVMNRTWAYMFNMFVMKKEYFQQYCEWMFKILSEVDKRIDTSMYTKMEKRAVSYMGEFMINIWLCKNTIKFKEVDVMFMEKQNWIVKSGKFILRKWTVKR